MTFFFVCLAGFFVALLGSIPMAGPVSVLVLSRAAKKKFDEALRIAAGSAVGEAFYAGVAFFGVGALLGRHPSVVPISRAVTAVVLVGLGVRFVFWKNEEDDEGEKKEEKNKTGPFLVGLGFTAINPTQLLTWSAATTALYAHGVLRARASLLLAIPFGISACAGVLAWWTTVTLLLRKYQRKLKKSLITSVVRGVGVLLVVLGAVSGVGFVRALKNRKSQEKVGARSDADDRRVAGCAYSSCGIRSRGERNVCSGL